MTEDNQVDMSKYQLTYQPINVLNVIIALLIPAVVGYFTVLLITSVFTFISRELWSIPVVWPGILYYGGLIGGVFGGIIAIVEVALFHHKNRQISSGKIIPSDLYYIGVLALFTYVLEFFSESLLLQVVLFILELGFFLVLGWNISKLSLESRISVNKENQLTTGIIPANKASTENTETE
ncbi:hypothetical protein CEE45_02420 [Candidatus Heimdallarchaeota archaeon B3_Heim]|nr:MAG: hypothetical protein CEE45_02420 [Candidatus Heimdallarchaeota archaeon B3_Heim]